MHVGAEVALSGRGVGIVGFVVQGPDNAGGDGEERAVDGDQILEQTGQLRVPAIDVDAALERSEQGSQPAVVERSERAGRDRVVASRRLEIPHERSRREKRAYRQIREIADLVPIVRPSSSGISWSRIIASTRLLRRLMFTPSLARHSTTSCTRASKRIRNARRTWGASSAIKTVGSVIVVSCSVPSVTVSRRQAARIAAAEATPAALATSHHRAVSEGSTRSASPLRSSGTHGDRDLIRR